jgi:hypothetical protein
MLLFIISLSTIDVTSSTVTNDYASTWISIPTTGSPPGPTCDHSTVHIDGRLFAFYGSDDTEVFYVPDQDIYVLDIRGGDTVAASWSVLTLTTSVRPMRRTSTAAEANPINGHIYVYGGYTIDTPTYLDDLWVLAIDMTSLSNIDPTTWSGRWHMIRGPSVDGKSNGGPFARSWTYMTWADTEKTTIILYGGLGAANADVGTELNKDQEDTWLLNATLIDQIVDGVIPLVDSNTMIAPEWRIISNDTCLATITRCADTTSIRARWPEFTDYLANLTAILDTNGRASELTSLLAQLRDDASFLSTHADDASTSWSIDPDNVDGNCSVSCSEKATLVNQPRPSEGHRGVSVDNKYYQFGGYACTTNGIYAAGGPLCYDNTMYILDLINIQWSKVTKPTDSSDPQYNLWPLGRTYGTLSHHKGKLYVFGGAYGDQTGVLIFLQDLNVFDIATLQWIDPNLRGIIPDPRWSPTTTVVGDNMWLVAGCSRVYHNDVHVLKIGTRIRAANCSASIYATTLTGHAGIMSWFTIQTRSSYYVNKTHEGLVWTEPIAWGTGLSFDVRLVSTAMTAQCVLTSTEVIELGDGLYNVTFIPELGATQLINVFLGIFSHILIMPSLNDSCVDVCLCYV